jgi:PTH1 family peptidyl-tRNA hydrolase
MMSHAAGALAALFARRGHPAEPGPPVKMIVGLGNPGQEYARHRHNVGFQVVDEFARRHGLAFDRMQKRARLAQGVVDLAGRWRGHVLVAKPMTYMNLSGEAVRALAQFYKLTPVDILVVHDDLDLPFSRMRLRPGGGAGGQKGVASTIAQLGSDGFARLRMGIGRPPGQTDPADFVLRPFTASEEQEMALVRPKAADAIEAWLAEGVEAAMNRFNAAP